MKELTWTLITDRSDGTTGSSLNKKTAQSPWFVFFGGQMHSLLVQEVPFKIIDHTSNLALLSSPSLVESTS